ncbi:lysostaphin resistance A-like protein [Altericista sp. CCNU0014]|uniref:CPBP family intramembrane glutamic endopeptidase n=1 Tax=Altericista sp. CCNU0014 TaxID=3082949 RepID=UPI00384AFB3A
MTKQWDFLQPKPYSGLGEGTIAFLAAVIWFAAILVRHRLPDAGDWSLGESLFEAFSFVAFAAVPIFGLATHLGERLVERILLPKQGLVFQIVLCIALALQIGLGKALHLGPRHFSWIEQFDTLIVSGQFWLNVALFLGGVFVALRIPFVVRELRQQPQPRLRWQLYGLLLLNTLYLSLHRTGTPWEGFAVSAVYGAICLGLTWPHRRSVNALPKNRLVLSDFWLMVLCAAILYWFSIPSFSFGVFIGVNLFVLVVVYGSGLGREHFGYSFAMQRQDWPVLAALLLSVIFALVPLAIVSGFVQPALDQNQFGPLRSLAYFVLFAFRVGIFEEVFFRSGVMVLLRDCLGRGSTRWAIGGGQKLRAKSSPQTILWLSAIGCSVLFGLSHIGNESGTNPLALWQYRGLYIVLATSASLFYSIAFAKTNRLAVPILVHGFVDTIAVVLLGGSLAVPF